MRRSSPLGDCAECGSGQTYLDLDTSNTLLACEDCGARTEGIKRGSWAQ